jgi:hypothetical protein
MQSALTMHSMCTHSTAHAWCSDFAQTIHSGVSRRFDSLNWLQAGQKKIEAKFDARTEPYAAGSIIPGSNYSAQDNHAFLPVAGT